MKVRFPYQMRSPTAGHASLAPLLQLALSRGTKSAPVSGLLDSGAAINVLPFEVGLRLGAVWEQQTTVLQLAGNLSQYEARGLILTAIVAGFTPVQLAFALTAARNIPPILGQLNFFMEFDVCFFRHDLAFELTQRPA